MASQSADMESANQTVLSYHDSLLRLSDVNLLKGPLWINDAIIGFYYEYLTHEYEKDGDIQLLFVSPPVTQLLKLSDHTRYNTFLDIIDVKNYNFIFFPLNNCASMQQPGGTHWSLLIYSRVDEMCYHYDSFVACGNSSVASDFARNLTRHFLGKRERRFTEMTCPQQNNSDDCGLHVLCLTDVISRHILRTSKISDCDYGTILEMVQHKRTQLLNLIETLRTTCPTDNE